MTPLKGTDPKLVSGGSPTRGMIREGMGNMNPPNTGKNPYSSAPLPKSGKPVGITEAGTRRMLATHEDTIWTTCHVTDLTDPDEIIDSITSRDFNPHIAKEDPRVQKWRHNRTDLIK